METVVINGTPRTELGKKATRALRKAGNVPCNLYGGKDTVNFTASYKEMRKAIYTPDFKLTEINLDGGTRKAIVKEIQWEPVKDTVMHVDFQELVDGVKVKVSIPLKLKGTAKGAAAGGKVEQVLRNLTVLALPKDLVPVLEVDITELDMGMVIRVKDVPAENLTILNSEHNPVARMAVPRAAKEEAAAAPAAAPAAAAAAPAKAEEKKDDKKK